MAIPKKTTIPNDLVPEDDDLVPDDLVPETTRNNANDAKDPGILSKFGDTAGGTLTGLAKLAVSPIALGSKVISSIPHPIDALGDLKVSLGNELDRASKDSEDFYKQGDPVRGTLAAIPFLGGAQKRLDEAIPVSPTKNVDYERIGEEGVAPVIAPKVLPYLAGKAGEVSGSLGRGAYGKAFPKNVDPETINLLIKEGVSGSPKTMASQVEGKLANQTHEMANLENNAPQNLRVKLDQAKKPLMDSLVNNMLGGSSVNPGQDAVFSRKLGQLEDIGSPDLSITDAIKLKRGVENEGALAGAFQGKGPLKPGQLAANIVTGGIKKGIGDVYPEYNSATERLSDLIDAKKATESSRAPALGLPYRMTPQALAAYLGYHEGGVPGGLIGAIAGGTLGRVLRSPAALTKGGLGAMSLGDLLQNPATKDFIMKQILLGQAQSNAQ